ncbi:MAG: peptide ABC transporter substrate-binding protein [Verrucomicrobiae bacterium]|nr:peptide ABC transporter substrate-binding protein [Verrucomicrobiae bacterium]
MPFAKRARRIFRRARFLLYWSVVAMAAGCSRREPPADLVIINNVEPESLDPALIVAQADMRIVSGMFEGLTRLEPVQAHAVPGLAESWDISPDGKVYTFHLRTNLCWSTGEPMTSADVVYSWLRALDPKTASRYVEQLYYLKNAEDFNNGKITNAELVGVSAPDKYTVRAELNSPTAFFLDVCAIPTLAVVPRQTIEKYGDHWLMARPLPVSGAFDLVAWRLNDKIRLKKNPYYWDATNTQAEIIDLLPVGSPTTALNLYERGQVDVVWDKELIPSSLVDVLLKRPDFHKFNYLGTYFVRFNVTQKPFNDRRVRQALALAVDKERITKRITRAGEMAAEHLVPPGTHNYQPPPGLGHDPERARKLLAEAGYPGGKGFPHFEYLFNASPIHEKIAVELQQMWHDELGIEMELRQVETQVFWGMQQRLEYQMSKSSWAGDYDDANTFLAMFVTGGGNNETGWSNPHYDELIAAANNELDTAKREKLFQQAETILDHDEMPIIPLYVYLGISYFDTNKVTGIWPNMLDDHPLQSVRKIKPQK